VTDELIFLGTAGGRLTVAKQLRASKPSLNKPLRAFRQVSV
jgi:hypothetical protein